MIPTFVASNSAFSAATGAKTVLNILASANQAIQIVGFGISTDGVTSSAVPATVDVCQSTQAGAGTAGATPTAVQVSGRTLAFQGSCASNYSGEPTTLTSMEKFYLPQFMGTFAYQYPLGLEPESDFSGGTVKALCLRINTTATVNVLAYIRFQLIG